jgi:hypothetical protein
MNAMNKIKAFKIFFSALSIVSGTRIARAQEPPSDYQQVLKIVGKSGDYKSNVLKVNIPRNDLHVEVAGYPTPTPFGFGGWFAMTKGDGGEEVVMGDLVLTQDEVNPVMSALLDHGLEVTALHNHFFWEDPRVFFMHIHGHGMKPKKFPVSELAARTHRIAGSVVPAICSLLGHEEAEKAMCLVAYPGREEQPIARSCVMVVTKPQRPQAVVLDGMSVGVTKQTIKMPAVDIINSDLPAAGIADKEAIAEEPEICRGQCHTPGRIQPRTVLQPLQQLALRREFVHESEARKIEVVVLGGVLLGIGHIQIPIDLLHVEWSKTVRDFFVSEGLILPFSSKTHGMEVGVVHFDTRSTDIRDVKEKWSTSCHLRDGRTFVNSTGGSSGICGVIHYHECIVRKIIRIDTRTPSHDRAVFGDKRKHGGGCFTIRHKRKPRCCRENNAGRSSRAVSIRVERRNIHNQGHNRSGIAVIQSRNTAIVV